MGELSFELLLLGPPVVRRVENGKAGPELRWRLHRSLQLVAFLAVRPDRRATREELTEALWPDASRSTIRKNFHPTLSDVRRTLLDGAEDEEVLVQLHGVYALSPDAAWPTDVDRFRALDAAGRACRGDEPQRALGLWRDAWELCRGPFLSGLEAPWIQSAREGLADEHLRLLRGLAALAVETGDADLAVDAHRSVLVFDPYDEPTHVELMAIYRRQGRRDLVHRQYVRLQELLKELGVEPLESTHESYQGWMR